MKPLDVVGLGEVCIDWTIYVEKFPEIDEKIFVKEYGKFVGGVTANFLVAFSRLGGRAGFLGGVGEDENGRLVFEALNKEKIDLKHLKVWKGRRTALNVVIVDGKGRKCIYQDPFLMYNVPDPEDVTEEYLSKSLHVHTTAIKVESAVKAFKVAYKLGLTTSLDLEKHVADYGLEPLKNVLKYTTILMPNKLGIRALTGERDLVKAARKIMKYGPEVVVITRGGKGSIVVTGSGTTSVPAFKVRVVDTTGAGDTFNAAFIYAITVKKWDYEKSMIFANAAAALKCTRPGAQSSPTIEEVREFLRSRKISIL